MPDYSPIVGWTDDAAAGIFGVSLSAIIRGISKSFNSIPFLKKISSIKSGPYTNISVDSKG